MKKKLSSRSVAVLCALPAVVPGLAGAQITGKGPESSVILGGQIKVGQAAVRVSGARDGASAAEKVGLAPNTSYFYFKGQETLNDRLKTLFHLEWDFSPTTGARGGGRAVFVGLADRELGALTLGRQSVYFSHHWFINDPHGAFDAAPNPANSLNVLGTINGSHFAGSFLNNTVRYQAPNFHGFSGIASYSFDSEEMDQGRSHTWYVGPTYTRGAFRLGYYHMERKSQGALPRQVAGSLDQTADRLAVGYGLGGLSFGVVVDRNKVMNRSTRGDQYRYAFAVPVNYGQGPHLWSMTYGQALSMKQNGRTQGGTGAKMLSLSYQYSLSKRTTLDATVVELHNDRNGRYNFWLGGPYGASQLPQAYTGGRLRMAYLGIKHLF